MLTRRLFIKFHSEEYNRRFFLEGRKKPASYMLLDTNVFGLNKYAILSRLNKYSRHCRKHVFNDLDCIQRLFFSL